MNGKLLTFEGIDGCGKGTQIRLLSEDMRARGTNYKMFREPGGTALGEGVRSTLLDPAQDVADLSELYLFNAARGQLLEEKVRPALAQGNLVVLDRFFDSSVAYQGAGNWKNDPGRLDLIHRLNESHNITPDCTFYLQIDLETQKERLGNDLDRMESKGPDYFSRVKDKFDELATTNPERFVTIDGTLPEQTIYHEHIRPAINELYDY